MPDEGLSCVLSVLMVITIFSLMYRHLSTKIHNNLGFYLMYTSSLQVLLCPVTLHCWTKLKKKQR